MEAKKFSQILFERSEGEESGSKVSGRAKKFPQILFERREGGESKPKVSESEKSHLPDTFAKMQVKNHRK